MILSGKIQVNIQNLIIFIYFGNGLNLKVETKYWRKKKETLNSMQYHRLICSTSKIKINLAKSLQGHKRKLQNHKPETKALNRKELDIHICKKNVYSPQLEMKF